MDIQLSSEERLLSESAQKLLERDCPSSLVRELRQPDSDGHSPALWAKLAGQGFLSLGLPEDHGGAGTLVDLGLVMEQAGRALVPTALRSTMQAALAVARLGTTEQQANVLTGISAGSTVAAVAFAEPATMHDLRHLTTTATPHGDSWVLDGIKCFVPNAHLADPLLVVARVRSGMPEPAIGVFCVPGRCAGLELTPQATFAHDRQFRVRLDQVRLDGSALLGAQAGPQVAEGLDQVRQEWVALLCAEMVGGAQKVLDMTASYVTGRQQFGRPIGSFQAVQHHIADMGTGVDGARLATYQALWRLAHELPAAKHVAVAKAWTGEAYKATTVMAHQLHGGMGYVTESDLHLFSEHAKATEAALGGRDHHLVAVADQLGL